MIVFLEGPISVIYFHDLWANKLEYFHLALLNQGNRTQAQVDIGAKFV